MVLVSGYSVIYLSNHIISSIEIPLVKTFAHLGSQQTYTGVGAVVIMALFLAVLLILCISEGSQGTTTNPPQQRSDARALQCVKELCEVSTKVYFS